MVSRPLVQRVIPIPDGLEVAVFLALKRGIEEMDGDRREVRADLRRYVVELGKAVFADLGVDSPDSPDANTGSAGQPDAMFMTVHEMASRSGFDQTWITRLCRSGTLQAKKVNGTWYLERDGGEWFLEDRRANR